MLSEREIEERLERFSKIVVGDPTAVDDKQQVSMSIETVKIKTIKKIPVLLVLCPCHKHSMELLQKLRDLVDEHKQKILVAGIYELSTGGVEERVYMPYETIRYGYIPLTLCSNKENVPWQVHSTMSMDQVIANNARDMAITKLNEYL